MSLGSPPTMSEEVRAATLESLPVRVTGWALPALVPSLSLLLTDTMAIRELTEEFSHGRALVGGRNQRVRHLVTKEALRRSRWTHRGVQPHIVISKGACQRPSSPHAQAVNFPRPKPRCRGTIPPPRPRRAPAPSRSDTAPPHRFRALRYHTSIWNFSDCLSCCHFRFDLSRLQIESQACRAARGHIRR